MERILLLALKASRHQWNKSLHKRFVGFWIRMSINDNSAWDDVLSLIRLLKILISCIGWCSRMPITSKRLTEEVAMNTCGGKNNNWAIQSKAEFSDSLGVDIIASFLLVIGILMISAMIIRSLIWHGKTTTITKGRNHWHSQGNVWS